MSISNFEGKSIYRIDYTTQENVGRDDTVTKEAVGMFMAETPEAAIAALREFLSPTEPTIHNVTLAMPGEELRFKVAVLN